MKKVYVSSALLMLALMCAVPMQAQMNTNRSIAPSKAQAKKMSILTDFTPSPSVNYFHDVVYAHESDMDLHLQILKPDTKPVPSCPASSLSKALPGSNRTATARCPSSRSSANAATSLPASSTVHRPQPPTRLRSRT